MRMKIANIWVVDERNLMLFTSKQNSHKQFEPLKNIHFDTNRTEYVSLMIGTDMPELHLLIEIKEGNTNKPIGIKLVLRWVLLGGNNKEKYSLNSDQIYVCGSKIAMVSEDDGRFFAMEN